jgi:acetyl/propionyl-CoA carboxylase alpha subunit
VYADGEEDALHVQACDSAVRIGPAAVRDSYGNVRALVDAAVATGCSALHPGYGLHDDDPTLARACERAGIALIGNPAEITVQMRDRISVRNAAFDSGLRVLPGSERPIREPDQLRADADLVGYPLVIKPAFGAGEPIDPVLIATAQDLEARIAKMEWEGAAIYVERHVDRPRHVEVQLVGDGAGNAAVVGDREVSMRKDHRRVLAESPAPALDALHRGEAVRSAMWAAAMDVALSFGLRGLGSAHFVLDARGEFFFVGLHPVLQTEHALHELCANVDLVEAQVRLANGEELPREIANAAPTGHAVQARIEAAADPRDGRPFPGRTDDVRWPPAPTGKVRIETAIQPRSRVQADHDPIVATVTTYAPTRHEALLLSDRIVAETRIGPLVTNLRLLRRALNHESFRAAQYDEGFLDRVSQST